MTAPLPYAGVRVLDLGQGLAGPYCGMLLAQWGADVVKVEPAEGDWLRRIGTAHGAHCALSLSANRGKQSIAGDLKHPVVAAAVQRIAAQCDVVIESFRPGVAARLGLGYAEVARANPQVVYVSVSGFGQEGEYAAHAGSDSVLQAFSGMMAIAGGAEGPPRRVGFLAVDTLTGLYAFQAVAAALHGKLAGQGGRFLDVNLMQSTAAFLAPKIAGEALEPGPAAPLAVPSGVYRAADGHVTIALSKEAQFPALCRALGREDLAADARFATFELRGRHAAGLTEALAPEFARRGADACVRMLQAQGLLASRVNTVAQWLRDPHVAHAAATHTVDGSPPFHLPLIPGVPAPQPSEDRGTWAGIGGDAADVLPRFGFSAQERNALVDGGLLT